MIHSDSSTSSPVSRWRLTVQGVVQGIGFRPFVHRLAQEFGVGGCVRNTAAGVEIEIEGAGGSLSHFLWRLRREAPALACITEIKITPAAPLGTAAFAILPGRPGEDCTLIPPDLATCPQCLEEVFYAQDRRFRYPFANCTCCGPRFTIIRSLPYERSATTMAAFSFCAACAAEYGNPADRRFYAEPVACPVCGPRVWLEAKDGAATRRYGKDDIARAAALLRDGAVVAVQGLGGFHLACDATNEGAVHWLRRAKSRLHKPLAVMVRTLEEARLYGEVSATEASLLTSVQAPIVLVRKRPDSTLASAVAPGNAYVGMMLPYTPLHHMLLQETARPLVMTSGNRRDEPLCCTVEEAKAALGDKVDAFLWHNRPIQQRCDDSVFFVAETGPQPLRRSRGYTPLPVHVPLAAAVPILAVGAELKNTFCLLRGNEAFLSQHIGDMGSLATQHHFVTALAHFQTLLKITPAVTAHDLHPDYITSRYAATAGLPLIGVQHHHAHIASCLADNGVTGPVIGVAFDGAGYGTDGAIWGGEFLIADLQDFQRVAHLEYLPLPGGEAAIRRPARTALAYLLALLDKVPALPFLKKIPATEQRVLRRMIERRVNTPLTSSCGRLFDAVAALIGLRGEATYEAQAAIELEMVSCTNAGENAIYPFVLDGENVRVGPLLAQIVADVQAGIPAGVIGRRFHHTLAEMVRTVCMLVRKREGLTAVALSGGCWQNRLLLSATVSRLRASGFTVYTHRQAPANDGGISLGQAVVAAARLVGPASNPPSETSKER